MITRRKFIRNSSVLVIASGISRRSLFPLSGKNFVYKSSFMYVELSAEWPQIISFTTDSLGNDMESISPVIIDSTLNNKISYKVSQSKNYIAYYPYNDTYPAAQPAWKMQFKEKEIIVTTHFNHQIPGDTFSIPFSQRSNHCTVLGHLSSENQIKFPCILHFPGMGTFRLFCNQPDITLFYDGDLGTGVVKIAFAAADADHPAITYRLESVAIHPKLSSIDGNPVFDGFKRDFINIFQFNPRRKCLSNNTTSDACAFTMFLYAEVAKYAPVLTDGLTAMDLVRDSLDQYLNGMLGYGMVGKPNWQSEYDSCDCYPSLVMAASDYILHTKDYAWAEKNYNGIKKWVDKMTAMDTNNDGIIEYGYSGNKGSYHQKPFRRPSNWWDTIGFGHDDAYSNALAYKAATLFSDVAKELQHLEDSEKTDRFAQRLKNNYYQRFFNPATGVLAGWRSADGELHDYYFTFVNGIAISYGLIESAAAREIMKKMLSKMKEVGFSDFSIGLPGNLIAVDNEDYADQNPRWGYGKFQVYENGGATGCYVYYTIRALYSIGMKQEAENILMGMMKGYKNRSFQGSCSDNGMTKDWKTWSGECWGYEGFLVDNYLAVLSVFDYVQNM